MRIVTSVAPKKPSRRALTLRGEPWVDQELAACKFKDVRLAKRLHKLVAMMSGQIGKSVPCACQDWANTKAAYRFFANDAVSEGQILSGHFQATATRMAEAGGRILMLHDTCEFSFQRDEASVLGLIGRAASGKGKDGRQKHFTVRGVLMHSSLAVTTDGLPLGLTAIKFWSRRQFKGCNALKRKVNPTRVPITEKESYRWLENLRQATARMPQPQDCVHIGDRESDIYELFCLTEDLGTKFLVRTCVNRRAGVSGTVAGRMKRSPVKGIHRIEARNKLGETYRADLEIKYEPVLVRPPIGKQQTYPALALTVIYATEKGRPRGHEKITWKLLTNLPVNTLAAAIEKLEWYALRWKIEVFHKILKSGCKAEESKLRRSERLVNLIAIFCLIAWRVFWLTMLRRSQPEAAMSKALTPVETCLLDELVKTQPPPAGKRRRRKHLSDYLTKIAQLGGYLARAADPPPGNLVMWRGLTRLHDIQLGFLLANKLVGN
jgi:hypothetical protein